MSETDTDSRFENETLHIGRWRETAEPGSGDPALLTEVPEQYNVVIVSGERGHDAIPDFRPARFSRQEFRAQVDALHEQGRTVLLAIGGPDARVDLRDGQEEALFERLIELTDDFGFDGVVLELAQSAARAGDNRIVIPAALKATRLHHSAEGRAFRIGLTAGAGDAGSAAEGDLPFGEELEGHYDFVARDGHVERA
ncbi:hypothetical protein [Nocardia sp. NPDC057668]|uniref:hypothetical protein n=1 Tax=Nocardia sp. NPDC057668 TaxID=3346202 RepID=UPI00366E78C0